MASTAKRVNRWGESLPLPVWVAGTDKMTLRENEGEGDCKYCGSHKRTLYSYEDESTGFCNRSCWMSWVFEGRGLATLREIEEVKTRRAQK